MLTEELLAMARLGADIAMRSREKRLLFFLFFLGVRGIMWVVRTKNGKGAPLGQ